MKVIEGAFAAPNAQVAIVISRFNSFINESLLDGAIDALKRQGQVNEDNITVVRCQALTSCHWWHNVLQKAAVTTLLSLWGQ